MEQSVVFDLPDEAASIAFAQKVAVCWRQSGLFQQGLVGYLQGDLGAGKSFFVRHFIQFFDSNIKVKSPTYTLVESYPVAVEQTTVAVFHFDLYRLCDPEEFEFLGVKEQFEPPFVAWIEWPEKGEGFVPEADIAYYFSAHSFENGVGRRVKIVAKTALGEKMVGCLIN